MKRLQVHCTHCRNFGLAILFLLVALCPARSQTYTSFSLHIPAVSAQQNDIITLPVTVKGFEQIISMQLYLTWEPDALQLLFFEFPSGNPLGLSNANFNPNVPGNLAMTWFDPNALGGDLPDDSTIFSLKFKVLSPDSDFFPILLKSDALFGNEIVSTNWPFQLPASLQIGGLYANMPAPPPIVLNKIWAAIPDSCTSPTGGGIYFNTTANGTPPYDATWTGPNGYTGTGQSISNLIFGDYRLQLTDAAGLSTSVQVLLGPNPFKFTGQSQATSCSQNDGCIKLSVSSDWGPIAFNWSTPGLSGDEVCDLAPGFYTVTATAGNGCFQVDSFEVLADTILLVNIQSSPANCANNQLGTALGLPQNGQAPYQFVWSIAASTQLISGLFSGPYYLTVTDALGCTGTAETHISDAVIYAWDLYLQANCLGGNGQGDLLLLSGNPSSIQFPVTLSWNNGTTQLITEAAGDTLGSLQMLPSGLYGLTVTDTLGCGQMLEESLVCFGPPPSDSAALVWPGDADNNNAVNHHDLLYLGLAYSATGPSRANASINWIGQPAADWPQNTGGNPVNFKNLDTNGDGTIDAADTLAISTNWGQVIDPAFDNPFAAPQTVPGMPPAPALSLPADTLFAGQMVYIPVVLGSAAQPADSIHGLAFSISYNSKILQAVYFEPLASWLGDPATELISVHRNFPGQNRLDIAISRTDGLPADGFGVIGRTFIIIEDDIFFRGGGDEPESGLGGTGTVETNLFVRNIQARTPSNTQPAIQAEPVKLVISQTVGTRPVEDPPALIRLSPNPVSELLHIFSPEAPIRAVTILNIWGQVQSVQPDLNTDSIKIPVQDWPKGAYLAQVQTSRGRSVQLFICH